MYALDRAAVVKRTTRPTTVEKEETTSGRFEGHYPYQYHQAWREGGRVAVYCEAVSCFAFGPFPVVHVRDLNFACKLQL